MTATTPDGRSRLIESSKVALLHYGVDSKGAAHNFSQRSIFWDREHVYNQNIMLKAKLKELEQVNTKTKTRLLKSEKQIAELSGGKGIERNFNILRSMSSQQLKSESQVSILKWRVSALKEQETGKRILLMKQQIRELKEEIDKLKSENSELKKSIKFTRMSELQSENKELMNEILRLQNKAAQLARGKEEAIILFAREKQEFRDALRKEVEARIKLAKELKKMKGSVDKTPLVLKESYVEEKRLVGEIRRLSIQNQRLKKSIKSNDNMRPLTIPVKTDIVAEVKENLMKKEQVQEEKKKVIEAVNNEKHQEFDSVELVNNNEKIPRKVTTPLNTPPEEPKAQEVEPLSTSKKKKEEQLKETDPPKSSKSSRKSEPYSASLSNKEQKSKRETQQVTEERGKSSKANRIASSHNEDKFDPSFDQMISDGKEVSRKKSPPQMNEEFQIQEDQKMDRILENQKDKKQGIQEEYMQQIFENESGEYEDLMQEI